VKINNNINNITASPPPYINPTNSDGSSIAEFEQNRMEAMTPGNTHSVLTMCNVTNKFCLASSEI
jgi:hypothetical protein